MRIELGKRGRPAWLAWCGGCLEKNVDKLFRYLTSRQVYGSCSLLPFLRHSFVRSFVRSSGTLLFPIPLRGNLVSVLRV